MCGTVASGLARFCGDPYSRTGSKIRAEKFLRATASKNVLGQCRPAPATSKSGSAAIKDRKGHLNCYRNKENTHSDDGELPLEEKNGTAARVDEEHEGAGQKDERINCEYFVPHRGSVLA